MGMVAKDQQMLFFFQVSQGARKNYCKQTISDIPIHNSHLVINQVTVLENEDTPEEDEMSWKSYSNQSLTLSVWGVVSSCWNYTFSTVVSSCWNYTFSAVLSSCWNYTFSAVVSSCWNYTFSAVVSSCWNYTFFSLAGNSNWLCWRSDVTDTAY